MIFNGWSKVGTGIDILDYVHRIGNRACARRIYRPSVYVPGERGKTCREVRKEGER